MASIATIILYTIAWALALYALMKKQSVAATKAIGIIACGIIAHAVSVYLSLVQPDGFQLSVLQASSLFFFVINLLVLVSSLRKPLHNLFLFLLPLSALALIAGELFGSEPSQSKALSPGILAHVLLSILAYSLLTIASVQALLLAYQNKQLKAKHFSGFMTIMPPLQTMEALLFDIVRTGFAFLTLSLITGVIYIEDLLAQHLAHKTVFSVLSWLIYATLLTGHQIYGWRGTTTVRWILGGFVALMLAYFGSKIVIEIILQGG